MLEKMNKYMVAFLMAVIIVSCSPEPLQEMPPTEGDVPVVLNGMLTRALGDTGDPGDGKLITAGYPLEAYRKANVKFHLSARTTDPARNYFLNTPITIGAQNENNKGRNKIDGNAYYPLLQKNIDIFAHTAIVNTAGNIPLTAGTSLANDVLLGKGTEGDGITPKIGNSDDPIKFITFKHLMTRVDVKIEKVDEDIEEKKPTQLSMTFSRSGKNGAIVNKGIFNIFTGVTATNNADGEYGFLNINTKNAKTHYLVSNGANLTTYTDQIVSSLTIDDYKAAKTELVKIRFPKTEKGSDFILAPGLAYDLTFVINHLQITGIKLTLKDWSTPSGDADWGVEPKKIKLSTGDDFDSEEITKMVLKYKHTDGNTYQFIGKGVGDSGDIEFVTLPANLNLVGTSMTANLYTKDGLLAEDMVIKPSDNSLLVVNLGKYGMKKSGNILEISTPLQLALMVNDINATARTYSIVKTIDMDNTDLPLNPGKFPAGAVLNGNGHAILHLNVNGNGLFKENNGILRHLRIASGLIKGDGNGAIGAICQTNNGNIESVVNEANIEPAPGQVAGGICGVNGTAGKILASVNIGNITAGNTVGGIAGENKNPAGGAIRSCLNTGMLNKSAANLGGIIGTSVDGTDNGTMVVSCFWLTGSARKNQAVSNELPIGNNPSGGTDNVSADLTASSINGTATSLLNAALSGTQWYFVLDKDVSSWPFAKLKN